jgi:putative lipoprotein
MKQACAVATFAAALAILPAQAAPALTGNEWHVQTVRGEAVPPRATLKIGSDGAVNGRGWCNAFGGRAAVSGGAVAFQSLITTMRACAEMRLTQLEADYLAALREVARWRIDGGRLYLSSKSGRDLVVAGTSESIGAPPVEESTDAR